MSSLLSIVELNSGGPGSGCNPEAGKCGRPKSGLQSTLEQAKSAWGPNNLWSKLAEYGHAGVTEPFSKKELHDLAKLQRSAGYADASQCKVGFCFMNAQRLAIAGIFDKRVQLVEGLVTVHGVPITHSWIEFNGKVYDPTLAYYSPDKDADYTKGGSRERWSDVDTPEYFGVSVPKEEIARHQLKTETYDPLSHEWADERLMKKIWRKPQ